MLEACVIHSVYEATIQMLSFAILKRIISHHKERPCETNPKE